MTDDRKPKGSLCSENGILGFTNEEIDDRERLEEMVRAAMEPDKHGDKICPECGAEMDEQFTRCIDADGNAEVAWVCPDHKEHEIAALRLERDTAQAKVKELEATLKSGHLWPSEVVESTAPHLMPDGSASRLAVVPSWVVEQFKALAAERGAMVVALRRAGEELAKWSVWSESQHRDAYELGTEMRPVFSAKVGRDKWADALTSTADAAAKVRREILEGAWERVDGNLGWIESAGVGAFVQVNLEKLRAAILGAGEP